MVKSEPEMPSVLPPLSVYLEKIVSKNDLMVEQRQDVRVEASMLSQARGGNGLARL